MKQKIKILRRNFGIKDLALAGILIIVLFIVGAISKVYSRKNILNIPDASADCWDKTMIGGCGCGISGSGGSSGCGGGGGCGSGGGGGSGCGGSCGGCGGGY